MYSVKYVISVTLITAIIMAVGGVLWNSGSNELKPEIAVQPPVEPLTTTQNASVIVTTQNATVDVTGNSSAPESDNTTPTVWERGSSDAPITIDVFPDFGCHICVEKELLILHALKDYSGKIRLVYHHFPSSGFNETLAESLEAAGEQGKFWEFHDYLYQHVPTDMASLLSTAFKAGLDVEKFKQALDTKKYAEIVRLSKSNAIARGVEAVSTYINGTKYSKSPGTLEDLFKAIDAELAKVGASDNP